MWWCIVFLVGAAGSNPKAGSKFPTTARVWCRMRFIPQSTQRLLSKNQDEICCKGRLSRILQRVRGRRNCYLLWQLIIYRRKLQRYRNANFRRFPFEDNFLSDDKYFGIPSFHPITNPAYSDLYCLLCACYFAGVGAEHENLPLPFARLCWFNGSFYS